MDFSNFVPDGYTEPGFIAAVPGLYAGIRFHFRPFSIDRHGEFAKLTESLQDANWRRKTSEVMASRLVDWDCKDANGNGVQITTAALLTLKRELWLRLHGILWGSQPSDVDPTWTEPEKQEAADIALEGLRTGMSPGATREAANEKNSGPG